MKRIIISAALATGMGLGVSNAQAYDGTITFAGVVTSQTCTVNGNGTGSHDFTVTLPAVSASALSAATAVAGRTPFNISLSACSAGSGNVHTLFESASNIDPATGNLTLNTGGASNVEIQLLNSDYSAIALNRGDSTQNSKSTKITAGTATLNYFAQYYATGLASAGNVATSVLYTMSYQ